MVLSHPSEKKKVMIGTVEFENYSVVHVIITCDKFKIQVMIGTVALIDLCLSNFELLQLPEGETGPLYLYNPRPRHTFGSRPPAVYIV
jgi:hypothetical protein